jgi:hypothetical protein
MFQKNILLGLKMKTVCFSKTVSTYESTWHHNPEEYRHLHYCENLKSHKVKRNTEYAKNGSVRKQPAKLMMIIIIINYYYYYYY